MFYIIDVPSNYYNSINLLKKYNPGFQNGILSKDHITIIYDDPELGIIGGINLNFKYPPKDFLDLKKIISSKKIWIAENLVFEIDNDKVHENLDLFAHYCDFFYRRLFEILITFSVVKEISGILMCLDEEDHQDIIHFGRWPFDWQTNLVENRILSHLTLDSRSCEEFRQNWNFVNNNRPAA